MNTSLSGLWQQYKQIKNDLKNSLPAFIKYEIITRLLITIVLIPIFKVVVKFLMNSKGYTSITNGLFTKFLFSIQGIISLLMLFVLCVFVILIEIGGLIVISHQTYRNNTKIKLLSIFKICLSRFKNLLGLGGFYVVLYMLILTPWVHFGPHTCLNTSINLPYFIQAYIWDNRALDLFIKVLTIYCFIMSIRWIFSGHIIILKNKPARIALKESGRLVSKNIKYFFKEIIGVTFIALSRCIFFFVMYVFSSVIILTILRVNSYPGKIVFSFLFLVGIILAFLLSFAIMPFEIHLLTRVYYTLTKEIVDLKIEDSIKKKNIFEKVFDHKKIIAIVFGSVLVVSSFLISNMIDNMDNIKYKLEISAHRGDSKDAPENTIASIKSAILKKSDYAEIDVQETKDGKLVLCHDKNLYRLTGVNKSINQLTLKEIKKLEVGSRFSEKFRGEKIPTLEEAIKCARGKIKLNIEIKEDSTNITIVPKVIDLLSKENFINSSIITSLNYNILQQVEQLNPMIETGYIMYLAFGDLDALNVDFYSIEASNVTDEFVTKAHMLGRQVHVWTVNEKQEMNRIIELGVDNIITDDVEKLQNYINKKNGTLNKK